MRIHIKFAVVDRKYELAWTGKLWTKAVERPVSGDTTRLHLRESLAGALVTLFLDSARLPRHHLTSLATNGREARQNKLATRGWIDLKSADLALHGVGPAGGVATFKVRLLREQSFSCVEVERAAKDRLHVCSIGAPSRFGVDREP